MIELCFWPTPNGQQASIMLEEIGLEYRVQLVNILRGEQFRRSFLQLNPNNKVPVIVDRQGPGRRPYTVFESGGILHYLVDKTGRLLPRGGRGGGPPDRGLLRAANRHGGHVRGTREGARAVRTVSLLLSAVLLLGAAGAIDAAELSGSELRALLGEVGRGESDAVRFRWLSGPTDPVSFRERRESDSGAMSQSGYANMRYDALLPQAADNADIAARARLLAQAEKMAFADHPVAPLHFFAGRRLVSKRASSSIENPRGIHLSRWLAIAP